MSEPEVRSVAWMSEPEVKSVAWMSEPEVKSVAWMRRSVAWTKRPEPRSVAWMSAPQPRSVAWMRRLVPGVLTLAGSGVVAAFPSSAMAASLPSARYIVQGTTTASTMGWLEQAGAHQRQALPGLHGAIARLTRPQVTAAEQRGLRITADSSMHMAGTTTTLPAGSHPSDAYLGVTGASSMFASGDTGQGVTVAVLDTGIDALPDFSGRLIGGVDLTGGAGGWQHDGYGHGTFVAGLIASSGRSSGQQYGGEAPGANLVSIKVATSDGSTSEGTVIAGIGWAIAHKATYNIRVLNISLGTAPTTPSAVNPLDQAVEQAWNAGIVVVTSAGNSGPSNGTITSPGDDPLVITVGALDDGGGTDPANFSVPAFSSVGPTPYDGSFKPDVVAPGRSVVSVRAPGSTIDVANPSARIGNSSFVGSGTSFSTAITSGLVALLLEQRPNLTPDQVKADLLSGTTPGPVGDPFVDGHGIVNASGAVAQAGTLTLDQQPALAAAAVTGSTAPGDISLTSTWAASSWNPSNWNGAAWNGAAWNGAAWNGAAWNGAAWNGAAWNGAAWNGAAWNGAAWNGAAWNGAAWNGAAWNGAAWNASDWS